MRRDLLIDFSFRHSGDITNDLLNRGLRELPQIRPRPHQLMDVISYNQQILNTHHPSQHLCPPSIPAHPQRPAAQAHGADFDGRKQPGRYHQHPGAQRVALLRAQMAVEIHGDRGVDQVAEPGYCYGMVSHSHYKSRVFSLFIKASRLGFRLRCKHRLQELQLLAPRISRRHRKYHR